MVFNLLIFCLITIIIFMPITCGLTSITTFLSRKYQKDIPDKNMAAGFFASAVLFAAISCFIIRIIRPASDIISTILVYMLLFLSILSVQQGFHRIVFKNRIVQWFLNILFCVCLILISGFLLNLM